MKAVIGNKTLEISDIESPFQEKWLDLGTGDGRFAYYQAKNNPEVLVVGVDPSKKQLEIYSKKSLREKLENVLFIVGSIEMLPQELNGIFNNLFINLPWGTLLQSIVKPTPEVSSRLRNLLIPSGELQIILGYTHETEPSETIRLNLPELSEVYIKENIIPVFNQNGFNLISTSQMQKPDLFSIQTTWGKKLSFGTERPIYLLRFLAT